MSFSGTVRAHIYIDAYYLNNPRYAAILINRYVSLPSGEIELEIPKPVDLDPPQLDLDYYNLFINVQLYPPGDPQLYWDPTQSPTFENTFVGTRRYNVPVSFGNTTAPPTSYIAVFSRSSIDFYEGTATLRWNNVHFLGLNQNLTVEITGSGSGTASPAASTNVTTGMNILLSATPDSGSELTSATLDGNPITLPYDWVVTEGNHTFVVEFTGEQIRIDHWIEGEGTIDSPASGFTDPGEYVVSVTPAEGYHLVSLDVDGTAVENGGAFNFSADETVYQVHAVFAPDKISLSITVTSSGTTCAPSGEFIDGHVWIFPVNLGAYVWCPPLWATLNENGGTDTQTDSEAFDYGDPVSISAQCTDIRNRLSSLTVNGAEQILPGELTTGKIINTTATVALTVIATFTADAPCFQTPLPPPGTEGSPPTGPTPGGGGDGTFPIPDPPGTPPGPEGPPAPPGGGGGQGGGPGGGTLIESVPPEDGGGTPPDSGRTRIFTPGWDRQTDMARLWIRWRDDNGLWSKEHPVDIGSPGDNEWPVWLPMRGDYSTRQWEVVITDRAPLVVAYLEEEVDGIDE